MKEQELNCFSRQWTIEKIPPRQWKRPRPPKLSNMNQTGENTDGWTITLHNDSRWRQRLQCKWQQVVEAAVFLQVYVVTWQRGLRLLPIQAFNKQILIAMDVCPRGRQAQRNNTHHTYDCSLSMRFGCVCYDYSLVRLLFTLQWCYMGVMVSENTNNLTS